MRPVLHFKGPHPHPKVHLRHTRYICPYVWFKLGETCLLMTYDDLYIYDVTQKLHWSPHARLAWNEEIYRFGVCMSVHECGGYIAR